MTDLSWIEDIEVTDQNAEHFAGVVTNIVAAAGAGTVVAPLIGLGLQLGLKLCNGGYEYKGLSCLQELANELDELPNLTVE